MLKKNLKKRFGARRYFSTNSIRFMNFKRFSDYGKTFMKKTNLYERAGRYQRRYNKDYIYRNNGQSKPLIAKAFYMPGGIKDLKNNNNGSNQQFPCEIVEKHTVAGDFLEDNKSVIFGMFFLTSKNKVVPLINGGMSQIIETTDKETSGGVKFQGFADTGYGIEVRNMKEVSNLLENIKKVNLSEKQLINFHRNVENLGNNVGEKVKFVVLNDKKYKLVEFDAKKFNFKKIETKQQLIEKARRLLNENKKNE